MAPPWALVPPQAYGGTEGVLDVLARGLLARGHGVVLYTVGDSTCPVPRAWVHEHAVAPMNQSLAELVHVVSAYRSLRDCDIVHDHTLAGPLWAGGRRQFPPIVVTNHGLFSRQHRVLFAAAAQLGVAIVAISEDQRRRAGPVPVAAVVRHGLDIDAFPVGRGDGGYAMWVGRFSPGKGAAEAIEIARRAGVPLRIAGKMHDLEEREYFHANVEPALGEDVVNLGEISPAERDEHLRHAVALLNPIQWDEPFGLVMVEALACGTPVVAFPRGAAPEIVRDGVTGFLVDDVRAAARALHRSGRLERATCRADAVQRFSAGRMVDEYVAVYRRVLDRRPAAALPTPRAGHGREPDPSTAPRPSTTGGAHWWRLH